MSERRSVTLCGHELSEPGHICAFFASKAERYELLAPYYREGVEQGDQVITIVDRAELGDHEAHLYEGGIEVDEAVATGALRVCTVEDTYLDGGSFAAAGMYDVLRDLLRTAGCAGRRVRASGVMDWTYRGHPGTEQLVAYEARVNALLPIYGCTLLCVYDLDRMNARNILDVLATHPYLLHRRQMHKNAHYRPVTDGQPQPRASGSNRFDA